METRAHPHAYRLSRTLRTSLLFFYGRFGLPIPFKVPLLYVVGAPIPITKIPKDAITTEMVDRVHAQVMIVSMLRVAQRFILPPFP